MGLADKVYAHIPRWGQDLAASTFGVYRHWLRFGSGYTEFLKGYREREKIDIGAWHSYQQIILQTLLKDAAEKVPYYRQYWTAAEKQAAIEGRLDALPLLSKDPIRTHPQHFLRDDLRPFPRFIYHTSGSTGTPIASYWTTQEIRDSRALREARSANWAGVSFRDPRATFSGRIVVPDPHSSGPFHRFNRAENQVYFSAFHLRPETAVQYVAALHQHKTVWLTGYAVSYYLLAKHILDQNLKVPPLRAVITTSEKVTPEMRRVMEAAYCCKVFEEYSTVENSVFASECEYGKLHVSPDAGILEIVRSDGTACPPGEIGEVIATSFVRRYQPFIRYRLGDLAVWDSELCTCGRSMPVLKEVVGRIEDVVVGPDGREMVRFHGIFVNQPHVVEGQIIQEALDSIRVKVVPSVGFGKADVEDIQNRIRQRLGKVQVIIETVANIPRSKAGKFQAVISLVSKADHRVG